MTPYYEDSTVTLHHGDCLDVLRELPDSSVDSVCCDPPYGLEFMGKEWGGADGFRRSLNPNDAGRDNAFGRTSRTSPEYRTTSKAAAGMSGAGYTDGANRLDRPSHLGGLNPKCRNCDKWQRGANPCRCESPDFPNERLPRLHTFQEWCEAWARECLRVLKPGGHMLAFGGTRTWHRLACAVEDAGFEIRDSIAWMYGCHDDQTEVLTRRGWVNGLDLAEDDDVAQWSIDGTVELVRPTARQRYDYDGDLIAFRNADVDQLVTPNHRVYRQVSERRQIAGKRAAAWSDWQVDQAADINRWQPMRLPAAGIHDGPGVGGTDYAALLGWVWAEGGFDPSGTGVRVYQSSTNAPLVDEIAALFDRLGAHKRYDYAREWKGRPYTATTWFITGDLARRVRADLPGKSPTYELLWRMTSDEKRALWDAAMKGDGSKAQRAFWQKSRVDLEWAQALLAGIGCRGKIADDPRGVIHWTDRPTVELQARHLAAAEPVPYLGEVWCVTVPSGAFIVRRNGRVSVSGNSGFPKSLDVSKAIDKAAGAEREVVGKSTSHALAMKPGRSTFVGEFLGERPTAPDITAPATPDAERWQGWGTTLKPAFEPIVVARKPLVGSVASNVLAHGTGALNIDATRIAHASEADARRNDVAEPGMRDSRSVFGGGYRAETNPAGRWPANVVLDESQAAALDQMSGERGASGVYGGDGSRRPGEHATDFGGDHRPASMYDDLGGASRFFYVAKADASERVRYTKPSRLRLRGDLTPEQVDHVRARLTEVGVQVD